MLVWKELSCKISWDYDQLLLEKRYIQLNLEVSGGNEKDKTSIEYVVRMQNIVSDSQFQMVRLTNIPEGTKLWASISDVDVDGDKDYQMGGGSSAYMRSKPIIVGKKSSCEINLAPV
jgi:hypothetical protein